jgi:class 3 adenylate cyclase
MHRQLKELLVKAVGVSEFVVAINLDVRGFSSFAKLAESSEAALFLKRIYLRILDEVFSDASFFKPTGDGLLIVVSYTEETLKEVLTKTVESALLTVDQFPSLCADDPMINFAVPSKLGIGMARGAATRLTSEGKILDYSGRPLNLASRLMDLARPSGIVCDGSFGIDLLAQDISSKFGTESVYVRSLAEKEPITIHYSKDTVKLSPASRQPIEANRWHVRRVDMKFKEFTDRPAGTPRRFDLVPGPSDPDSVQVRIEHPVYNKPGGRKTADRSTTIRQFTYREVAGKPGIHVRLDEVAHMLTPHFHIKPTSPVTVVIEYPLP